MSTDVNAAELAARQAERFAKRERSGLSNDDRHLVVHPTSERLAEELRGAPLEEQPARRDGHSELHAKDGVLSVVDPHPETAPIEEQPIPPAVEAPPSPAEPKVVSEMTVKIFDTGHANILGPINDPLAIGKLIEAAFVCYVHHYARLQAQLAVQQTLAQLRSQAPKGSFIHRILDRVRAGRKSA